MPVIHICTSNVQFIIVTYKLPTCSRLALYGEVLLLTSSKQPTEFLEMEGPLLGEAIDEPTGNEPNRKQLKCFRVNTRHTSGSSFLHF